MFCQNCGKEMKVEDKICSNCGHHFERDFSDNRVATPSVDGANNTFETAFRDIQKGKTMSKKKDVKNLFAIIGTLTIMIILIIIAVFIFMKKNITSKGVFDRAIGYFLDK